MAVTKYRLYQNEKRVVREKGVRRVQTPKIITTKWDPEIAKNKTKKIGRARARDDKYGDWNETDCSYEDKVSNIHETQKCAIVESGWTSPLDQKELKAEGWTDRDESYSGWSCDMYDQMKADEETARAIKAISGWHTYDVGAETISYCEEVDQETIDRDVKELRAFRDEGCDDGEYIFIANELREDFDEDWRA